MLLCWLFRNRIERETRNLADSHVLSIITTENELGSRILLVAGWIPLTIYPHIAEKSSPGTKKLCIL